MIKLIATDMDGTLLNSNNEINKEFYDVFNKLQEKEIIFAAASGRQYYNLRKRFDNIKDNMLFIAENGTFVVYKGEEILVNALDMKNVIELINIGRNIKNADIVVCGKKSAYVERNHDKFINEVEKYYERYEVVEDLTQVEDEILKVTICDFEGAEVNSNNYYDEYKDKLQICVAGQIWLDITVQGANKGYAIEVLREKLGIDFKEVMVFGDYLNDLEMMQSAYYSYAMENAHPDLKKVSRFIAKSNDENGVVEKIKEICNL